MTGKQHARWQNGVEEYSNLLFFVRPILVAFPLVAYLLYAFGLCCLGYSRLILTRRR